MTAVNQAYTLFASSLGLCGMVWKAAGHEGAFVVTGFQLPEATQELAEARLRGKWAAQPASRVPLRMAEVIERVRLHLEGQLQDFRDVALELDGIGGFVQQVYAAVRAIPAGQTMTYGQVAAAAGRTGAAQAVGTAMSRNPVPLIIPCHRVLAAGGKPGGFSAHGGLTTKARMLEIEGAITPAFQQLDLGF